MAIKRDEHGNVLVTGDHISLFRSLAIKHALRLEVNHGLKRRGRSILQIAREDSGQHFSRKKEALRWYEEHYPDRPKEGE